MTTLAHVLPTTITGNTAKGYGGGVTDLEFEMELSDSTISDNVSNTRWPGANWGGGVYLVFGKASIQRCHISNNDSSCGGFGGGVQVRLGTFTIIRNCTFSGNSGAYGGILTSPPIDSATARCSSRSQLQGPTANVAVSVISAFIVKVMLVAVPVASPLHALNVEPIGIAVRTTSSPCR